MAWPSRSAPPQIGLARALGKLRSAVYGRSPNVRFGSEADVRRPAKKKMLAHRRVNRLRQETGIKLITSSS